MNFSKVALTAAADYKALGDEIQRQIEQAGIPVMRVSERSDLDGMLRTAAAVSEGEVDGGVIITCTGLEGVLLGNKFQGVRASRATSSTTAMYTRCHNRSNLLTLGAGVIGPDKIKEIVASWLSHEFIGGRHAISVGMIQEGETCQFRAPAVLKETAEMEEMPARPRTAYPFKRIIVANDHAGFEAKHTVLRLLRERQIEVTDLGTDSTEIVRYPYYAARVAQAVLSGSADGGILLCGTGIGMSIAANKFKGIRAVLCTDTITARQARLKFDANVLCVGGKIVGAFELEELLKQWLDTPYSIEEDFFMKVLWETECRSMKETDWKPVNNI